MSCTLEWILPAGSGTRGGRRGRGESAVPDARDQVSVPPLKPADARPPRHGPPSQVRRPATTIPEPAVLAEAPAPAPPGRPGRARRRYVVAAAFGAVALLALGAVYLTTFTWPLAAIARPRRDGAAGTVYDRHPAQRDDVRIYHEGSGPCLAWYQPAMAVRVGVDRGALSEHGLVHRVELWYAACRPLLRDSGRPNARVSCRADRAAHRPDLAV